MAVDNKAIADLLIKFENGECSQEELDILDAWYEALGKETAAREHRRHRIAMQKNKVWRQVAQQMGAESVQPTGRSGKLRSILQSAWTKGVAAALVMTIGLLYFTPQSKHSVEYATIEVPRGLVREVTLADRSTVWLNGGSRLRYPANMDHNRKLYLDEGEAFFDVTHNDKSPFIVQTATGMQTKVLGTAFTIQSYHALNFEKVTVLRGRVKVVDSLREYAVLGKGQGAEIRVSEGTGRPMVADPLEINGWTTGQVILNDVSFDELSVALQNTFGMEVRLECDELRKMRNSISFSRRDDVVQVMNILKMIYHITYTINRSQHYITINGDACMK